MATVWIPEALWLRIHQRRVVESIPPERRRTAESEDGRVSGRFIGLQVGVWDLPGLTRIVACGSLQTQDGFAEDICHAEKGEPKARPLTGHDDSKR
jgi:hypothetical protein